MPPSAICCSICCEIPSRNGFAVNRSGSRSVDQPPHRDRADEQERTDGGAALLPHQDAQHDPAHPGDGEDGAHDVDVAGPGVGHVAHEPDAGQDGDDDHDFEREPHAPGQERGDEAAEQRSDCRGDRRRGTDEGVDLLLRRALEVAVDQ
jgi:hypothetical protein